MKRFENTIIILKYAWIKNELKKVQVLRLHAQEKKIVVITKFSQNF